MTLGFVGTGNAVCGYLNKWGAGANDTVRFYVGLSSSKEMHINLQTIFKNFIFTANSTTLRTYKITETPSDVMHKQTCSEIYRTMGGARCAYCNEENNYGLFVISDTSTHENILVCAFQVMNHILEHSCIMIPDAHNAFRQKLNINGTTGKMAEKQSELENFLILYSKRQYKRTVPNHRAEPAVEAKTPDRFQHINRFLGRTSDGSPGSLFSGLKIGVFVQSAAQTKIFERNAKNEGADTTAGADTTVAAPFENTIFVVQNRVLISKKYTDLNRMPIVNDNWLMKSLAENKILDFKDFAFYDNSPKATGMQETDVVTDANKTADAQDVDLVAGTKKRRNPVENPGTVPTSSKKQHNTGGPATASLSTQVSCVPFRRANAFCALHCSGCNKKIQPTDTYTIDKSKKVYCEDCGDSVELLMESTFQRIAQKQQEKLSNSGEEVAKCGLDACERDVVLSGIHVRAANVLYHLTCFSSREEE